MYLYAHSLCEYRFLIFGRSTAADTQTNKRRQWCRPLQIETQKKNGKIRRKNNDFHPLLLLLIFFSLSVIYFSILIRPSYFHVRYCAGYIFIYSINRTHMPIVFWIFFFVLLDLVCASLCAMETKTPVHYEYAYTYSMRYGYIERIFSIPPIPK